MPSQKTAAAAASTATATTAPKKKPSASSIFSLKCGCKDAKSVSISNSCSDGSEKAAEPVTTFLSGPQQGAPTMSARPETSSADTITSTTATTSTSHEEEEEEEEEDDTPSFSGLLRQLSELERSIATWDRRRRAPSGWVSSVETEDEEGKSQRGTNIGGYDSGCSQQQGQRHQGHGRGRGRGRHRRSQSEGGSIDRRVLGRVGESVAVVKQTEDPLGDFRRSMLQMIVEKEILSGEELRQLLFSFLALNSPSHHPLIIRAFADIWRDVFSGYSDDSAADLILQPPFPRHRLSNYVRNRRYS